MNRSAPRRYIPALSYRWLTPVYDPVVRWTTREDAFKAALLEQAGLRAGQRMLDLGCGTGTLSIKAKLSQPDAEVTGIDGDPEILDRARRKAEASNAALTLDRGLAQNLPYRDATFDVVLSSLFFHHLGRSEKVEALREAHRVLAVGGELHIADWGKPAYLVARIAFLLVQMLDGFANTSDNVAGRLPELIREAGFTDVAETRRFVTPLGSISLYRAVKTAAHHATPRRDM